MGKKIKRRIYCGAICEQLFFEIQKVPAMARFKNEFDREHHRQMMMELEEKRKQERMVIEKTYRKKVR